MNNKTGFGQVKIGAVFSYCLIILSTLYALLITPYILKSIGSDEYGVYKIVASFSSVLTVLDFGLGGTVQRYVANYRSRKQDDQIPNFTAMSLIIALGLNLLIIIVSGVIFFSIRHIYGTTLSGSQIILAQNIFIILVLNLLCTVVENVLNGVITGHNDFIFGNGVKIVSLLSRAILIWILLKVYKSAVTIVLISLGLSIALIIVQVIYIGRHLNVRIKLMHWDKRIFLEAGKYTGLMFLTSIAVQVFSNVDNMVIGALCGPTLVAVYSIGLQFFGMFQNISAGIAGVMLPTVTNAVIEDEKRNDNYNAVRIVIKAGRIQFILLGAALIGFICIGKDFIYRWLGSGYDDVYIITIILLTPAMFELCINVCLSILRAKNKLGFRTAIVIISAIFNATLTIILIKGISYIGAAVATAISYIVCSLIAMNIYYVKKMKLPMLYIYKGIISKVWICLLLSGAALFIFSRFVNGSWFAIFLDIAFFCLIYAVSLFAIQLNDSEREKIPVIGKILKKYK